MYASIAISTLAAHWIAKKHEQTHNMYASIVISTLAAHQIAIDMNEFTLDRSRICCGSK